MYKILDNLKNFDNKKPCKLEACKSNKTKTSDPLTQLGKLEFSSIKAKTSFNHSYF